MKRHHLKALIETSGLIGDAAELGVASNGLSLHMLAWGIFPTVYLVDRWAHVPGVKGDSNEPREWHEANYQRIREKVRPYGSRAMILRGETTRMAELVPDESLSLLYIDADHTYQGVSADIEAWIPKMLSGGYVVFDDYDCPDYGVTEAVDTYARAHGIGLGVITEDLGNTAAYFQVS